MAEIFTFVLGIAFGALILAYLCFKCLQQAKQAQQSAAILQAELEKTQASKLHQQEEIHILHTKLHHAFEDTVTPLLGWKLFEDRLNQNLKESARHQLTLAVLFVDIDDFKMINDALSYEVGDALLREVAKRLQTCIRQVDSASRFAKDTFVILLTQLAKPETAALVAQRLLQVLAEPFQINQHELYITVCIGIAIYPTDGQEVTTLLRSADHALHLAKEKGNHVYQFYQEKLHVKSQRDLLLYTSLNRESIFQEFVLFYQPIINVENEAIVCMDVLLHWQHPDLGLISPQELFNYVEKQKKLNIISEWLLQIACRQFLHWRSLGFQPELICIPLPSKQLENSHFIYRISQILQELAFEPSWLLLEIQESTVQCMPDVLEKSLNRLNYLGVKIAIDEFGSGIFPLAYLKEFSIHYLKLATTLISDIDKNERAIALIQSIVFLAKSLSMQIIVQGVESEQQIAKLKELGCTLMQGKLLGAPLSESEIETKMVTLP